MLDSQTFLIVPITVLKTFEVVDPLEMRSVRILLLVAFEGRAVPYACDILLIVYLFESEFALVSPQEFNFLHSFL